MKHTPPIRVLPFSLENLRAVLPTPKMPAEQCPICRTIGVGGSRLVKGGTVEYNTIPAAVQHLKYFLRLGEWVETHWLNICPQCDRLYYCEESSEFLIPDSEEYKRYDPILPEKVLKLAELSWAKATGKAEIHAYDNGTWCIIRDPEKLQKIKNSKENLSTVKGEPSSQDARVQRMQPGPAQHSSSLLVQEILAAAGQPVSAHTLDVGAMQQAVQECRVLQVYYWSHFGEGEASFGFATDFGVDGDGNVHASYLVFPRPIPPSLRRSSESHWEKADEVFAAFGVESQ